MAKMVKMATRSNSKISNDRIIVESKTTKPLNFCNAIRRSGLKGVS